MEPKGIPFEDFDAVVASLGKTVGIGTVKGIEDRLQPTAVCICTADKGRNLGIKSISDPVPEFTLEIRSVGDIRVFYAIENAVELLLEKIGIGEVSGGVEHDIDLLQLLPGEL